MPQVSLPGSWTRIPQYILHGTDSAAERSVVSQHGDERANPGEHYSQVLLNNIHFSWPRTNIHQGYTTERFQYHTLGWNLIEPASEQIDRELPMLTRTPIRLPHYLLVMYTHDMNILSLDVVTGQNGDLPVALDVATDRLQLLEEFRLNAYNIPLPIKNDDQ